MIYEFAAAVLFLDDRGAGTLHKGSGDAESGHGKYRYLLCQFHEL